MNEEKYESQYGYDLATYEWIPERQVSFLVYLMHGYAEYNHRFYLPLIALFKSNGGAVFAHDHFGHGESGPYEKTDRNRCQLRSFDESADDIIARIEIVKEKYPEKKVILCGHSMGGLLSCLVAEKYKVDGAIMIAPALKIHPNTGPPWLIAIGKWLGFLVPFLKVAKVKSEYVSRRADVVEFYNTTVKEKYGDNGGSTAGFGLRLLTEQDRLLSEKYKNITCPVLLTQGTDDFLCAKEGADIAAEYLSDVEYKVYQGGYHQLHADLPETTDALFRDINNWLKNFNIAQ